LGISIFFAQTESSRKDRLSPSAEGPKLTVQNERIKAAVGNDGRFTIGTVSGKPLLYGFSREGATSHTHFYVDGSIWGTYDSASVGHPPVPPMVSLPTEYEGSVICRWNIDGVLITQTLTPSYHGDRGTVFIEYLFENTSSVHHSVGLLLFYDTMIGRNDYAPISTEYGFFSVEREFLGTGVPSFWQAYESSPFQ
jgi:hypothetical protein